MLLVPKSSLAQSTGPVLIKNASSSLHQCRRLGDHVCASPDFYSPLLNDTASWSLKYMPAYGEPAHPATPTYTLGRILGATRGHIPSPGNIDIVPRPWIAESAGPENNTRGQV
ncbi:hypothetical protein Cob_v005065 [Colletotrichum orbiculare MAFF 240422]|uniref:Uncharacterized protein n=1 Tax=Colletotrichum orbiculare (strain 104-T / ATCC 96160 / CBS 514.97 / LARS 414 / MAFF 240422) TaxID=1213857 RepID=A0A484FW71_COLOR|nr:hypothetical protein Cob_v005065 [Colletotrichum orbiculare MAFF 240422]